MECNGANGHYRPYPVGRLRPSHGAEVRDFKQPYIHDDLEELEDPEEPEPGVQEWMRNFRASALAAARAIPPPTRAASGPPFFSVWSIRLTWFASGSL